MSATNTNTDVLKPWTIKTISTRVIDAINETAPKLGLNNGQLVERLWDHWDDAGQSEKVDPLAVVKVLTQLMTAAAGMPEHVKLPSSVRGLMSDYARIARAQVAPSLPPGKTIASLPKSKPRLITHAEEESERIGEDRERA